MRRIIPLIALFASIAGCTSVGEMRSAQPMATFTSEKSPQDVASCIRDEWNEVRIGGSLWKATMEPRGAGYQVSTSEGVPSEFVDVVPRAASSGATVNFYGRRLMIREKHYIAATSKCADRAQAR